MNEDLWEQMILESDTVLVTGLDQTFEFEDINRTSLLLPKVQVDLIEDAL